MLSLISTKFSSILNLKTSSSTNSSSHTLRRTKSFFTKKKKNKNNKFTTHTAQNQPFSISSSNFSNQIHNDNVLNYEFVFQNEILVRNSLQDVSGDSIYQSCNGLDETHLTSQCYVHHHNLVEDLNLAIQLDKELNFHNLVEEGRFNDENLDVDENLAILLTFQFLEEDSQNRFFTNNNILTTETISRLERTKKECCICMEELKFDDMENEVRALRCIHVFHSSCIDNWITSGDNHNCPICRLTINE